MAESPITHDTFVIERTYPKPPSTVFKAFSDQKQKKRWYVASEAHRELSYSLDFRVDGQENLTAEMLPGTPIAGAKLKWSSRYVDIVPNERIVFSQVLELNENRISCALITVSLATSSDGCKLLLTHQAAFFEGADGPEMRRTGWETLLDKVASFIKTG